MPTEEGCPTTVEEQELMGSKPYQEAVLVLSEYHDRA